MITDIPNASQFEASGVELLNVAWGLVLELYYQLEMSKGDGREPDAEMAVEFWQAARRTVATALVLAHQGSDTLLQGRIASVSPFLLISGSPRDWPRGSHKDDTAFSAFRTHDSQDLPRVHDVVQSKPVSEEYRTFLERLREARNRAVHTVEASLSIEPVEVLRYILQIAKAMVPSKTWLELRREYLSGYPLSVLHSDDHVYEWQLPFEVTTCAALLGTGDVQTFFGFSKKQRRYICPSCSRDVTWRTVVLRPDEPGATGACCVACAEEWNVVRTECRSDDCKGDVIHKGICLTCGASQERDEAYPAS